MKENLPSDYGRIYQFPNFRSMIKQIQLEQEENQTKEDHAQVKFFISNRKSFYFLLLGPRLCYFVCQRWNLVIMYL